VGFIKIWRSQTIPTGASMKFPPKPATPYLLPKPQDRRILKKLNRFSGKKLTPKKEDLIKFLYSQLETDWRMPLEEYIDKLLK